MKTNGETNPTILRRRGTSETAGSGGTGSGRVVVVEDEPDVAELIRYNLAKEGYEVVLAPNGADALRLIQGARPDIVLLDIMIPQLNGWEVCRRLKQDPDTRASRSSW